MIFPFVNKLYKLLNLNSKKMTQKKKDLVWSETKHPHVITTGVSGNFYTIHSNPDDAMHTLSSVHVDDNGNSTQDMIEQSLDLDHLKEVASKL